MRDHRSHLGWIFRDASTRSWCDHLLRKARRHSFAHEFSFRAALEWLTIFALRSG
jgi:hypothetical protein